MTRPRQSLWPSELIVSDVIGRLIEFWGFKRNMGRVWSVLYLSPQPLSAEDLRELLQLSSGAVSMTLSELSRWGVVRKVWIQGERKDFFAAEVQLWKMISRVFNEREKIEILAAIEAFEQVLPRGRAPARATRTRGSRTRRAPARAHRAAPRGGEARAAAPRRAHVDREDRRRAPREVPARRALAAAAGLALAVATTSSPRERRAGPGPSPTTTTRSSSSRGRSWRPTGSRVSRAPTRPSPRGSRGRT